MEVITPNHPDFRNLCVAAGEKLYTTLEPRYSKAISSELERWYRSPGTQLGPLASAAMIVIVGHVLNGSELAIPEKTLVALWRGEKAWTN